MKITSKWLRGFELALWVMGLALLAIVSKTTLGRWTYQAQQERALFQRGPALSVGMRERKEIEPPPTASLSADEVASEAIAKAVHAEDHDVVLPTPPRPPQPKALESDAAQPAALGRLEIPRLGLGAIVADATDDATLSRAVGHVRGTALPGERGNTVFAGHRDTFFRPLRNIEVNDSIRFVVPPETYEYRVRSMRIVEPDDASVLSSNGTEELTLVTCYPFTFIGAAPERFVVVATRVN